MQIEPPHHVTLNQVYAGDFCKILNALGLTALLLDLALNIRPV